MEQNTIDLIQTFLWFLGGAVTYRFLYTVVNFGQLTIVFEEMNKRIIMLAYLMDGDMDFIRKKKYEYLKEGGMAKKELQCIKDLDDRIVSTWNDGIVRRFFTVYPPSMHRILQFHDWDSAVKYAAENIKKES